MQESNDTASLRVIGSLHYLLFLLRGPLFVTFALIVLLLDFIIPGSMKEALRYALLDSSLWYQFLVIAAALLLACTSTRFSAEAIVELVSPDLVDHPGIVGFLIRHLPRLLALSIGLALAWPLLSIAMDWSVLQNDTAGMTAISGHNRLIAPRALAIGAAMAYIAIAAFVALVEKGPHTPAFVTRDPSLFMRVALVAFALLVAGTFAVAVLGVWQKGISDHAVEQYSAAFVGGFSDHNDSDNALQQWVYSNRNGDLERADCDQRNAVALKNAAASHAVVEPEWCDAAMRYQGYVTTREVPRANAPGVTDIYVDSTVSPAYVMAMLLSLFAACVALRLALAISLDVLFPRLGYGGPVSCNLRRYIPPLGSLGLSLAVAAQVFDVYLGPGHITFYKNATIPVFGAVPAEQIWALGIIVLYLAIGALASLGSGSKFVGDGSWRESHSVGRRVLGAARRLAALDPYWRWLIRGLLILGLLIFLLFADLRQVQIPQWIGPVGIMLLWGATTAAVLFLLSYFGHMTRIPFLTILLAGAGVYAGFNINDNHVIRTVHKTAVHGRAQYDTAQKLNLVNWIAARPDKDKYDHYPVFLVATEGGGIRAAYFTASILSALQDRCPAFAQHTIAISGVSGGSLGASTFAALAADRASDKDYDAANPGCLLQGKKPGPIVQRARKMLSADLLSPLLGAALFPDTLQRMIPVPIGAFDRAIALEYAVEKSWRDNATRCQQNTASCDRLGAPAMDLYDGPGKNVVPNLFLNTTEAGTGAIVPFATAELVEPPFRDKAQIDDRNVDCVDNGVIGAACLRPRKENLSLAFGLGPDRTIALSTAAIVSARFPYLTPAGGIPGSKGSHVDGGYFENSGTFKLSELLQNLISQQTCLRQASGCPNYDNTSQDAKIASNAVFIVIVIQSEPCTRSVPGEICAEYETSASASWSELLSPLRALLSTRDKRASYSIAGLGTTTALIEQMRSSAGGQDGITASSAAGYDGGISCDYIVCAVTMRFLNKENTDIPLTWLLSSGARHQMDVAVSDMEKADVRLAAPSSSMTNLFAPSTRSQVLGSYRRVLCLLADRKETGTTVCVPAQPPSPQ